MRISDWSSDVCASDLFARAAALGITSAAIGDVVRVATVGDYDFNLPRLNLPGRQVYVRVQLNPAARAAPETIGQLTVDRKSVVQGQSGSVRVDLGGRRFIKHKSTI